MDNVSRGLKNGGWYRGAGETRILRAEETPDMETTEMDRRRSRMWACRKEPVAAKRRQEQLYMKATSTKIGGIFLAVTGYVFGIASLVFVLLLCLGAVAAGWGC